MSAVVPVTVSSTTPQQSTAAAAPSEMHASLSSERKLFEYVAEIQAQSGGKAGLLANPAALGGEAMKLLKGYFNELSKTQDLTQKVHFMSEDKAQGASAAKDKEAPVHAGPAKQNFEPAAQNARGGAVDGVQQQPMTETELSRTTEMLLQSLRLAAEGNLIGNAASGISRSVTTLLKGQ